MDIAIAVVLLVVALFLVVKGGDVFVSSSAVLAKKAHIPQIIFGVTLDGSGGNSTTNNYCNQDPSKVEYIITNE